MSLISNIDIEDFSIFILQYLAFYNLLINKVYYKAILQLGRLIGKEEGTSLVTYRVISKHVQLGLSNKLINIIGREKEISIVVLEVLRILGVIGEEVSTLGSINSISIYSNSYSKRLYQET